MNRAYAVESSKSDNFYVKHTTNEKALRECIYPPKWVWDGDGLGEGDG